MDNVENSAGTTKKSRYVELKSTAEDGSITEYSINLQRPLSTNKALAGLSVNGTALADFDADTYTYNVIVANGCSKTPDITALRSSQHQTISFVTDGVKPATITVMAEDGTSQNYTINFVEEKAAEVELNWPAGRLVRGIYLPPRSARNCGQPGISSGCRGADC